MQSIRLAVMAVAVLIAAASVSQAQVTISPGALPRYTPGQAYNSGLILATSPTGSGYVNYHLIPAYPLPRGLRVGWSARL